MAPLDDELRAALRTRADALAPSPDPLAGIERRARGIRRRRIAASVAGAALAVSAVAVGATALQPAARPGPAPFASPSVAPPYALDPNHPWAYRGIPMAELGGLPDLAERVWLRAHNAASDDVEFSLLYGHLYEPAGQPELVFLVREKASGQVHWAVALGAPDHPTLSLDVPVRGTPSVLLGALPGDEAPRLVVVGPPQVTRVEYAPAWLPPELGVLVQTRVLVPSAPGVAFTALEGKDGREHVTVTAGPTRLYDGPAPEHAGRPTPPAHPLQPANVLVWPTRGIVDPDLVRPATAAATSALAGNPGDGRLHVLFAGHDGHGVRYLMGQVWLRGGVQAYGFSYTVSAAGRPAVFLGPATSAKAELLAFDIGLPQSPGSSLLVVVPSPRTTQVLYDTDGVGALKLVSGTSADGGVVLIPRTSVDPVTESDRLQLLTGNGDPATDTTFQGPVLPLLCGRKGCG